MGDEHIERWAPRTWPPQKSLVMSESMGLKSELRAEDLVAHLLPSLCGVKAEVSVNSSTDKCCRLDSLEEKNLAIKRDKHILCYTFQHCPHGTQLVTEMSGV